MNQHSDDRKIAADFNQLRQVELQLTPGFHKLLEGADERKPAFNLLRPAAGFAAVVLTMSILAVVLLRPDNQGSSTDFLSSVDEMPTDFLLETPWSQLASLGPGDQLLDLPLDLLEDLRYEP